MLVCILTDSSQSTTLPLLVETLKSILALDFYPHSACGGRISVSVITASRLYVGASNIQLVSPFNESREWLPGPHQRLKYLVKYPLSSHKSHRNRRSSSSTIASLIQASNMSTTTRTRRPHTRSKTGCLTCRKRRVRCDGGKPTW